jgi:hypothetical protein
VSVRKLKAANTEPDARKPVKPTKRNRIRINVGKGAPKMTAVPQPSARPSGSTGTSRARRRVSCEGTPRRARVPPVDYRDGRSPCQRNLLFPSSRA